MAEDIPAVKASHAQEGLAGIELQRHRLGRAAADGQVTHFARAVIILGQHNVDDNPVILVRIKILGQEGDQAVFAGPGVLIQGRRTAAGGMNLDVFERVGYD